MRNSGNLDREFAAIDTYFSPRAIAAANGQFVKLAKMKGAFVWHAHADEDELFLIHRGSLIIRYQDRDDVVLGEGDFHVVPRGVTHAPLAEEEAWVLLFEPAATLHTGDTASELTRSIEEQTRHWR